MSQDKINMELPQTSEEIPVMLIIGMPAWDPAGPFHSIVQVAGIAKEAGFSVNVLDLNIEFYNAVNDEEKAFWTDRHINSWPSEAFAQPLWEKYRDFLTSRLDSLLRDESPSIIGFSVNMCTRQFSINAAKYIKRHYSDIPVMFGGIDCYPAEQNHTFLSPEPDCYCDLICQGEAEIALKKYLVEFAKTKEWRTRLPGFAYYEDGRLVDQGHTELPDLREKLPVPAYDAVDLSRYAEQGRLPFFLTRGCPYRCNFCSERPNSRRFRARRADEAIEELKAVLPYALKFEDVPTIAFADSNLNASMKELNRFVDLILENDIRITWGGQAHIHGKLTREFLEKLKKSGFSSVFWGIESGSQHVVDLMNKQYAHDEARRISDDCIDLGIRQNIPIIVGYPGETPADVVDTLDLILRFRNEPMVTVLLPGLLVVRPGSPLYEDYSGHGLANNLYYEWSTADGTNNLHVRIARIFYIKQAHGNEELNVNGIVEPGEFNAIKLNDKTVATDIYYMILESCKRAGSLRSFLRAIDNFDADAAQLQRKTTGIIARIRSWAGDSAPGQEPVTGEIWATDEAEIGRVGADASHSEYLARWLKLNKDSNNGRERLYEIMLLAIKSLLKKPITAEIPEDDGKRRRSEASRTG